MKPTTCKKCPADIVFAKSRNDKWMPMDAEPAVEGPFWLDLAEDPPIARKAYPDTPPGDRYTCHFDTCAVQRDPKPAATPADDGVDNDIPF